MNKILVAEDEISARDALVAFFESQGFEVRCTADGEDAIKIGDQFQPDVLVTDWLLEGDCSGVSVARALAGSQPRPAIIMVTGYPLAELRAVTADLDVEAYLEKPISLFELSSIVDRVTAKTRKGNGLPHD
jgi:two-component system phosphate regulon response regulator PhoB